MPKGFLIRHEAKVPSSIQCSELGCLARVGRLVVVVGSDEEMGMHRTLAGHRCSMRARYYIFSPGRRMHAHHRRSPRLRLHACSLLPAPR